MDSAQSNQAHAPPEHFMPQPNIVDYMRNNVGRRSEINVEKEESSFSSDSLLANKRCHQIQTGRKPVPFAEYRLTRQRKIDYLQRLSNDKTLSAKERKRYRAQKYALQKRLLLKLKVFRKSQ